jgi:hypothetical protein
VQAFARLPAEQYATGWVLCCVGRAHYEMVDYPQAARAFEWARQADPTRLEVCARPPRACFGMTPCLACAAFPLHKEMVLAGHHIC